MTNQKIGIVNPPWAKGLVKAIPTMNSATAIPPVVTTDPWLLEVVFLPKTRMASRTKMNIITIAAHVATDAAEKRSPSVTS